MSRAPGRPGTITEISQLTGPEKAAIVLGAAPQELEVLAVTY